MSDYKKSGGFGGGKGKSNFDRRDSGSYGQRPDFKRPGQRSQGFTATCAQCNKQCEVPFRPNGRKPVYCRECFSDKKDSAPNDYHRQESRDRDYPKRDFTKKDFSPTFSSQPPREDKRIDELKRQIEAVNAKLDRLIQMNEKVIRPEAAKTDEKRTEKKVVAAPVAKVAPTKIAAKAKKAPRKVAAKPVKKAAKKKK